MVTVRWFVFQRSTCRASEAFRSLHNGLKWHARSHLLHAVPGPQEGGRRRLPRSRLVVVDDQLLAVANFDMSASCSFFDGHNVENFFPRKTKQVGTCTREGCSLAM